MKRTTVLVAVGLAAMLPVLTACSATPTVATAPDLIGVWSGPGNSEVDIEKGGELTFVDLPFNVLNHENGKGDKVSGEGEWILHPKQADPSQVQVNIPSMTPAHAGLSGTFFNLVTSSGAQYLEFTLGDPDAGRVFSLKK